MNLRDKVLAFLYHHGEATIDEIVKSLKEEDKYEIDATLKHLEKEGYVIRRNKGIFFKKTVYDLTAGGLEEAKKIYDDLQNKANEIKNMIANGELDPSQIPEEYLDILPLLISMSLIEIMLLEDLTLWW